MLTAGATFIKFGVMPRYSPDKPSRCIIFLKSPSIVASDFESFVTAEKQKGKQLVKLVVTKQKFTLYF